MGCIPLSYSGCKGNANRFLSIAECMLTCAPRRSTLEHQWLSNGDEGGKSAFLENMAFDIPVELEEINVLNICEMEVSKGPCHNVHTRFFFSNGNCMEFDYTGCKGNLNNFESLSDCQHSCNSNPKMTEAPALYRQHICNLPKDKDSILGHAMHLPRLYYNSATGSCESFNWNGEGPALGNRFESKSACMQFCIGVSDARSMCQITPEVGLCRAHMMMYAYYPEEEDCLEFIYGGCGGNSNR